MYGFGLIIVLAIAGGVIAYIGDRIGMKVGRRRMSIFKLRPKHTSIIVTVITGIVVSTGTLTVLTVLSEDVRTALFHIREIQTALTTTRRNLKVTTDLLKEKATRSEELTRTIRVLTGQVETKAREFDVLTARYANLQAELGRVVRERNKAEKDLAQVRGELTNLTGEYENVSQEYSLTKGNLDKTKDELTRATSKITELQETEKNLVVKINNLQQERERLDQEVLQLTQRIDVINQGAKLMFEGMSQYIEGMSLRNVIFLADQIIATQVVEAGRPIDEVKQEILKFLVKANAMALKKGAKIEGSDTEAIYWFNDNLERVYEQIHEAGGKGVVRLISATNATAGQPVYAYLEFLTNEVIFRQGDVIAKRTIDGSELKNKVQDQIVMLLVEANSAALSLGMVCDDEGRVGQVTDSEFKAVLSEVLKAKKPVEVGVVATEDVWRAVGPLKWRLMIL